MQSAKKQREAAARRSSAKQQCDATAVRSASSAHARKTAARRVSRARTRLETWQRQQRCSSAARRQLQPAPARATVACHCCTCRSPPCSRRRRRHGRARRACSAVAPCAERRRSVAGAQRVRRRACAAPQLCALQRPPWRRRLRARQNVAAGAPSATTAGTGARGPWTAHSSCSRRFTVGQGSRTKRGCFLAPLYQRTLFKSARRGAAARRTHQAAGPGGDCESPRRRVQAVSARPRR